MKETKELKQPGKSGDWKKDLYIIIFRANTIKGRRFDVWLLVAITLSVIVVLLDSVPQINESFGTLLPILEWTFTILFTIEYIIRIIVSPRKWKYIFSALGIIDLLPILPAYMSIFNASFRFLLVLRSLRLLRIFKILHLGSFMKAGRYITEALLHSYRKILLFMMFIILLVIIIGSFMYVIEVDTPGFESIPNAIYWAAVTITTVGYGDVSPITPIGKFLSVIVMLCGYSIIAVPTGIVTAEMARGNREMEHEQNCPRCGHSIHLANANYCNKCGMQLREPAEN